MPIAGFDPSDPLARRAPAGWSYGFFKHRPETRPKGKGRRLAANQLKGFHVIPLAAFRTTGGYDELFQGYASGADTDLEDRLTLIGAGRFELDPAIIESVSDHGDSARLANHRLPLRIRYATRLGYRQAKLAILKIRRVPELPLETRRSIYESAAKAAGELEKKDRVAFRVSIRNQAVGMPRARGFDRAGFDVSIVVEISGTERLNDDD